MAAEKSNQMFGGVSFKLNKSTDKSTIGKFTASCETAKDEDATEYINRMEDNKIKGTKPDKEENELIIPLIKQNVWRLPQQGEANELNHQAVLEILQETRGFNAAQSKLLSDSFVIPLGMQNRIPQGFETEDKMDVSLRPDSSRLEDYERIPVNSFGLAMLRGMGWKPGKPIGLRNKECVEAVEVVLRPKGLGLGANCSAKRPAQNQEELPLRSGSFVCVESGFHRGRYGQIESLDEDTGRAVVRLGSNGDSVSLPELSLRVVEKKEFQKEVNVINGEKFRQRLSSLSKPSKNSEEKDGWLRSNLRVRFVDNSYARGKYFNTKMTVEEVSSGGSCTCRTENSRLLTDICSDMLETVVPRSETSMVMVLRGRKAGCLGQVVERDKHRCLATVRLSSGKLLRNLTYDDICEVVPTH